MKIAPVPTNENLRQKMLDDLGILDTLEERAYDDLTFLASQLCETPIALVSLIDRDRQWFKSHHGLSVRETPRDYAFCAHAILGSETFIVEDSDNDERFHDNPLVTGEPKVKFYAGVPLILENNIPVGTLCVIDNHARTITNEQKRALQALSRQVVSQLELRRKLKEIQSLDKAKDDFISTVSHELRTPLTAVNGSLSLLKNKMVNLLDGQAVEMVDIAYRNSERLLNIVNDILDAARIDSGMLEMDMQPVEMISLVREAAELMQPYVNRCECELVTELPASNSRILVTGDGKRLAQVMNNLISNAAKFSYSGEKVVIKVELQSGYVRVSVTDKGEGIPEEKRPDVFSRFSKISHGGNRNLPGTGLGLNISKEIIERHNGQIGFESSPDEYTTFYFTLPVSTKQDKQGRGM